MENSKTDHIYVENFKTGQMVSAAMSDVLAVAKENEVFVSREAIKQGNKDGVKHMRKGCSRFEASMYIVQHMRSVNSYNRQLLSTGLLARHIAYVGLGDPFRE